MQSTKLKQQHRRLRQRRIKARLSGTAQRPRLSVFRSSKHLYAQLIDDTSGKTLVSASSKVLAGSGNKTVRSVAVGADLAEKAKAAHIDTVVFDRGGYKYHGRVKALADAAREGGLKF